MLEFLRVVGRWSLAKRWCFANDRRLGYANPKSEDYF